jgi:hypothetical protein
MRIAAVICPLVLAAGSVAFAANGNGHTASAPTLEQAIENTWTSKSERYAFHVRMIRDATPISLHVRGQTGAGTISVSLRLSDMKLADGTQVPGPKTAALIDGPFLYERVPSTIALDGKVHWLRLRISDLPTSSKDVESVHALTPKPLLRVLGAAQIASSERGARGFHGTIAYDDPSVRRGLAQLMGGLEFRGLRISAVVGRDGLVHRIVMTGHTADGKTTFSLRAHLFGFGKPVHVTPPAPGTFIDPHDSPPA